MSANFNIYDYIDFFVSNNNNNNPLLPLDVLYISLTYCKESFNFFSGHNYFVHFNQSILPFL